MTTSTPTETIETVVVGGGQAGLALGHHLTRRGRPFVILDALQRVGDSWRRHYDSLRLYSPAALDGLPGTPFPAPRHHHPTRDEVADYLEEYAIRWRLPVRTGTRVDEVVRRDGGYVVVAGRHRIAAGNVVVATGTFGRPFTPAFAADLDPGILQLHSSDYRNPSQLQPGPVLVVGASHSGADIALEVADSHTTILAGRDTGEVPFDLDGPAVRVLSHVLPFVTTRLLTTTTPVGRKVRAKVRSHGAPLLRVRRRDLAAAGVERVEARVVGTSGGRPQLAGGRVVDAANVLWCTGFRHDLSWVRVPVLGEDGWPREQRGVVPDAPGLYFMGLAFQHSFGSMLLLGVGRDADHVASHIAARATAVSSADARDRPTAADGARLP